MIHVNTITVEDIQKILKLYEEICGGNTEYVSPERACEALKLGDTMTYREGWRIGSKWSMHSKLRFGVRDGRVIAFMYENFNPEERRDSNPDYVAAKAAGEKFKRVVLEL